MQQVTKQSIKAAAIVSALLAASAFAQAPAGGIDYAAPAAEMKSGALAALSAIGVAVLAVAAAFAAFRKGKSLVK
jgi:hypothetical protein